MKALLFLLLTTVSIYAHKVLQFQEGVIEITEPIIITESHVTLKGKENTVLKLAAHANCPILIIGDPNDPAKIEFEGIIIKDLRFDGNRGEQDFEGYGGNIDTGGKTYLRNNCITVRHCKNVTINDCTVMNARSGGIVLEKHCKNIVLNGINAHHNFFDGIAACESTECLIMNSILHSNDYAGLSCDWKFDYNKIFNLQIHNNRRLGIYMRDSNNNMFEKLIFTNNYICLSQRDDDKTTGCCSNFFNNISGTKIYATDDNCKENYFISTD